MPFASQLRAQARAAAAHVRYSVGGTRRRSPENSPPGQSLASFGDSANASHVSGTYLSARRAAAAREPFAETVRSSATQASESDLYIPSIANLIDGRAGPAALGRTFEKLRPAD